MNSGVTTPKKLEQFLNFAQQAAQAEEKSKSARFYRLAGDVAFAHYANEDAISYYQNALSYIPDSQTETRYSLMASLERVQALIGQTDDRNQNLINLAALADALDSDPKRAEIAARLALFKLDNGEHEDVISISRLASRIAHLAGAFAAEADIRLVWGRALLRLGNYDSAQSKLQQALALAQNHSFKPQEANSYRYLGVLSEEKGQFDKAKSLYKHALSLYENMKDHRGNSDMLNNLGKVAYEQGDYTSAMRYWDKAKPSYLTIGNKSGLCRILINQSAISLDLGNYLKGKTYSQEALALSQEIQLSFGEALALINMASADHHQGELDSAYDFAKQALELAQSMKSKRLQGYAYNTLGRILMTQENASEASEQYWQAFAIWHELEQKSLIHEAEAGLMEVALNQDDLTQAQSHVFPILPDILEGNPFEGSDSPFRIYWLAYQVLQAVNDAQAIKVLIIAHQLLQDRAKKIVDASVQKMFLEKVNIHHLICSEVLKFKVAD